MSSYSTQAAEAAEQYLAAVRKVQDATIEAVSNFTAKLPDAAKGAPVTPPADLPSAEEITAAYFDFTEKLVANQKAYTERFIAAAKPSA